jgi:hypothetical protein
MYSLGKKSLICESIAFVEAVMSDASSSDKASELVSAAIDSDTELQAIRAVLGALVPLKREGRTRVLDYVFKRLGIAGELIPSSAPSPSLTHQADAFVAMPTSDLPGQTNDIRSLTKEKAPRSANEMAALVAYYLAELAPEPYRKQAINAEDIKTYFKQAPFPLPSSAKMTLINAKNSGYLESSSTGHYRLNPVGYNLVVHGLPAETSGKKGAPKRKPRKKKPSRRSK